MRYLKTIILLWVSILACLTANAQSANSHTTSAGGGSVSLPGGNTLGFTVGESFITTIGTNPLFTQGLHQTLLSFSILDVNSPNVVTTYKEGGVVLVTVTFDQAALVTGVPEIALNSGGKALYTSGSGTPVLTFTYTVAAGENSADLDYSAIGSLTLPGGATIQNGLGANAPLTLPVPGAPGSLGANQNFIIDTTAPNAPSTPVLAAASDSGVPTDQVTNITLPVFTGTAEAGSTVTLYDTDGTTVLGTAVATGGNWSITSTVLAEGVHTVTVKATDAAGNESPASTGLAVTIDLTPPTLAITSDVPQLKTGETATITFTFSEDPGATFTWDGTVGDVVVAGGTLGAISGSGLTRTATFTPTASTNGGTASITVAAATYTDLAGNDGGAGTTPALTFDTSDPAAPSAPVLATASDSGFSNTDNITNVITPVFTGTAEAGSTVNLYDTDGVTVIGTGIATGGNWSITASTLTPGIHTVTAKATDAANNVSPASTGLAVTIDTTSPTLAITSSVPQLKTGETATITFTFSEDPGTTFNWDGTTGDVVVTGGTLAAISGSGLTRTATFTPTASTNGGTASITVAAATYTDIAGNNGGAGTTPALTFDTSDPAAPSTPVLATASDSGVSNSDNITNVTTPVFTGTAEAGSTVTLYDTDGVTVLGTAIATGGNWSITASTLTPGIHTVTAKATDAANNVSPASTGLAVTIDTTSPTLAITSSVPQLKTGETATITFTFSEDPGTTFNWDGTTGDVVVTGGTLAAISGSGLTRTATFTPTASTNGGTASITVAAATYTDIAGNNGGAGTTPALTFDTSDPAAPSTPVLATASDSGVSNSDNITNVTTPVFTGTAEAGSTVTLYDTDGVTALGTAIATGGNWSITASTLTPGVHTVTAKATDAANNVSPASTGLAVTIDTTSPTLAITSNVPQLKTGETATITFTFSEDPGTTFNWDGTTGDVVVTGGTLAAISGSGLTRTATFTPTAGTNAGTASITVAAATYTDIAGNNGGAGTTPALTFDTSDPAAPSAPVLAAASDSGVSNSDNITNAVAPIVFTGTAEAGSTVTLYGTDGVTAIGTGIATGGNWSITASTPAEGVHTVTAKATDGAGNVSPASTGLIVTIDTTSPTLAITSNVPQLKTGETATITFTFSEDPSTTFAWDGTTGDVVVTGGTLGAISGSGLTRTATFTPTASTNGGTASITVAAATYTDIAGNNGGAGTTPALTFDTSDPAAPSAPVLASASDSGFSNTDNVTNVTTPVFTGTAEAGSTVTLYDTDGVTVIGTGIATGGNWSITASTLTPGIHTVTAKATDAANNVSPASTGLAVTIDTTSPTLAITSNVPQLKTGETATITFTFSEDPGTTFNWDGTTGDVVVTGGTLAAISGSGLTRTAIFTPTASTNAGTASITVAAATYTDIAGNNGGAGTTPALTFDTSDPAAPSAPVLATASDSGFSNTDNITNVTTPVFTGTAEAGSTITLYDTDGVTVLGTAIATGGNWSITASTLTPGVHTVTAKATDAANNVSPASTGLAVTIDTTSPTLAITSNVPQLKTGETATITFTFSEDPGTTFNWDGTTGDVIVTGGTLAAISGSGLTRTAIFTPTAGVNAGTAGITVAAATYTDIAGNNGGAGTTPALTFDTSDPAAPSAPVLATASDSGFSNTDNITNVTTPVFTGTAEAGSAITLYDTDGTTVLGTAIAIGGNWSITASTLTPGVHTVTAKATDAANNVSPASTGLIVTIDTTSPTLAITSNVPQLKTGETATITFTFSEDPGTTFNWDGTTGDVVVTGGTLAAISGSGLTRTATFTPTASTNAGTASITVAAATYTDIAGNNGGAGTTPALTFDTSDPAAPSAPVLATASDSGFSNTDNITNVTTPVFTGTAEAGSTITLYDTDGVTVLGTAIATGGNWSITASALTPGIHTITAKATDAANNVSPASTGLAVTIDTTSPTLAIASNVPQLKTGETATIIFTFSEDPGTTFNWDGTTGDVVVTGGTLAAISGSGLTRTAIFTSTASTNAGTASITVAAATYTDIAGNNGGAGTTPALTFDTSDPTAPSAPVLATASDNGFSNTDNITNVTTPVFTGTAEAGSTITLYDTDGVTVLGTAIATGGNWSITASTLTPGVHTVTAKATDAANNVSPASTGLAVTIDTTSPTLAITSSVPQLKTGETATITFTFSEDPGTTFNWDGTTGDVVVTGGTLAAISGSGLTRTAIFTPTASTNAGTASITVAAATYTDIAGNNGGAGTTPALTFDTSDPAAPSAPVLAAGSDNGFSNTDNITNVTTPVFTGTAEAGSTITLYDTDGVTVLGTAIATGGNWSITASTLTPGVHTITAKATDAANNVSPASTGLAVTIDTTSPTLAITSSVPQLKTGETAAITFTFSEDPGTTFNWDGTTGDVVVTGGTLAAISGSGLTRTATFTPSASTNAGTASITVAAATYTDIAGNNGGAGTTPALTFDTSNPAAPSTPVLATASDSGVSNTDNITNVTTPVFTGTAEAGSTITLYDTDGVTVIGTGIATGGNWSITASTLTPGVHTVTAKATDAAGNVSPASTGLAVTIDTGIPVISSIALADPNPTMASSVAYTVTFSKIVSNVDVSDFSLATTGSAAGTIAGITSADNTVFSVTVNTITGSGTIGLNLNNAGTGITDVAGNSIATGLTGDFYTFDRTIPTLSAVNIVSDNSNPVLAKVGNTATLTFTASETLQTPVVTIAGHAVTPTATGNNWTATYTFTSSDTEGLVAYNIAFSDLIGNAGVPVSTGTGSVTFDRTAPTLSAVNIVSDNVNPLFGIVGNNVTLTFTSSEALQIPVVTIAGHTVTPTAAGNNWTATYTLAASDAEGLVPYQIAFIDLAGNAGTPVSTGTGSVTLDKSTPTLSAVEISSNNAIPFLAIVGNTATLTFTSSEPLQTPMVTIAGHIVTPTAAGNNWTATYTFTSADPDGLVTYNIAFSDLSGNAGTPVSTGSGSVTLDKSVPTLSAVNIVSDHANPTLAIVGNTATLTFTSSEVLQTPDVTIAGHTVTPTAIGNNWTATYTFTSSDAEGLVAYNIDFIDMAGNAGTPVSTGTGSVTFDRTVPTLTAVNIVSDFTVPTLAKVGNTATLTFTASETLQTPVVTIAGHAVTPTAAGNNWTAVYTFTSTDPEGLVAYNIAFSDVAGNAGTPVSTGTGSVTFDRTAPAVPAGLTAASGDTQVILNWTANSEPDLANYRILFGTSPSPTTFLADVPAGTTTFTNVGLINGTTYYYRIQAIDQVGNASALSADVSAIPKASQSISFAAIAAKIYGDPSFLLGSANSSAGLPVTYTADDPTIVSITGNVATILKAGSTSITASQAGNTFFNPAPDVIQMLTVNTRTLTIVNDSRSKVYGDVLGSADFTGSITGIQNGDNIILTRNSAGGAATAAAGTYPIVATLADPDNKLSNYAVSNPDGTLTVGQKTLTIAASNLSKFYGSVVTFTGSEFIATGLTNGNTVSSVSLSSTGAAANATVAGSDYDIVATAAVGTDLSNYNIVYTNGKLTVNRKGLTITADAKEKFLGAPIPTLTASYTGLVNGESSSVLTTPPTLSTTATASSPLGTYDINVSGASADNYAITYQKGTLTIKTDVPTSISLASVPLYENAAPGASAGTLNSTSDNTAATFTYSLVTGTGDTDNGLFSISGDKILSTTSLDFETKASYKVRVRSTTQNNSSLDKELTISLTDVNEVPTLSAIGDQTLCATTVTQTVALAGISAGPETGQTTTLSVSSSNSSLFESLTASGNGATGTLSYRLKSGAAGTATVTVMVTDNGGIANGGVDTYSRSFLLTVNAAPVVSISSNKGTQVSKGDVVTLTATGGSTYVWANSEGILNGQNTAVLTVRPRETTTYTVTATNANGCSQSQTFTLGVLDDLALIKGTNIITPNGDGFNDKWIIDNIDFYPNNEVKVFDKAGRILYTKRGYDNSWDATLNGRPLDEGTYYYIIDFGTNRLKFRGFITVVREN
jgi:gliding motility-associated-like protein